MMFERFQRFPNLIGRKTFISERGERDPPRVIIIRSPFTVLCLSANRRTRILALVSSHVAVFIVRGERGFPGTLLNCIVPDLCARTPLGVPGPRRGGKYSSVDPKPSATARAAVSFRSPRARSGVPPLYALYYCCVTAIRLSSSVNQNAA